jgi:hypothetical protein
MSLGLGSLTGSSSGIDCALLDSLIGLGGFDGFDSSLVVY